MRRLVMQLLVLILLQVSCSLASAAGIPSPSPDHFYILDQGNILSPDDEVKIQSISSQLASKTKAQVVVLTVQTLSDRPIEEYALDVVRQWGIGDKQLNNGVLILVAINDRKSRIEVGYGLEGALPDAKTGRIQDEYMLPYFKKGDYAQGILRGYSEVIQQVAAEYQVTSEARQLQNDNEEEDVWYIFLILGLIIIGICIIVSKSGGGGPGNSSSNDSDSSSSFSSSSSSYSSDSGGGGSGGGGGSSRSW